MKDVRQALERARAEGSPDLSAAADEALQGVQEQKTGYSPNTGHLSKIEWREQVGHGVLTWEGGSWDVWDYGDKLTPEGDWPKALLEYKAAGEEPESSAFSSIVPRGTSKGRQEKYPTSSLCRAKQTYSVRS